MSTSFSSVEPDVQHERVVLGDLQHAWLTEIGLERRLLAHYRPARLQVKQEPVPQVAAGSDSQPTAASLVGPQQAMAVLKHGSPRRVRPETSGTNDLQPIGEHFAAARTAQPRDLPGNLSALHEHAKNCQACDLQLQRDQLVFGAGDTDQPEWLIVGEAPGKADDRTGLPFQGKAGKLLHAMLVAAGIHPASLALGGHLQTIPAWSQPTSMYFTNLTKCRPLGNRSPATSEMAACFPYLTRQIELLQPRRILALGQLAAQALLQVDDDVEQMRGQVHQLTTGAGVQIPVVVTWHPAVLLVHPHHKALAWADLNLAKQLGSI